MGFVRRIQMLLAVPVAVLCTASAALGQAGDGNPDYDPARRANQQMEKNYEKMKEEVARPMIEGRTSIEDWKQRRHPYYMGVDEATIKENNKFDEKLMKNPATYDQCLDYEQIGWCIVMSKEGIVPGPFQGYYVPFQKAEQVPEPFRTGYMPKEVVRRRFDAVMKDYATDRAPKFGASNLNFARDVAAGIVNSKGGDVTLGDDLELSQEAIDAGEEILQDPRIGDDARLSEVSPAYHGYLKNEYHLMPGLPMTLLEPPSVKWQMEDPFQKFQGWCHVPKAPQYWYSEFPSMVSTDNAGAPANERKPLSPFWISREAEMSYQYFFSDMLALFGNIKAGGKPLTFGDPLNCLKFNLKGGFTPKALGFFGAGFRSPCQGINQGKWVPVTDNVDTMYATTAAAIGMTRSRVANRVYPELFHDVDPLRDKVQWLQNDRMDGPIKPGEDLDTPFELLDPLQQVGKAPGGEPIAKDQKPCRRLERWVLDYEDGNLKLPAPDHGMDHWNVLAHWRKIQCCLPIDKWGNPALPLFPIENWEIPGDITQIPN